MAWLRKINRTQIHPGLWDVMERTLTKLDIKETPFKVYSGLRTFAEQNKLYAQGRTAAEGGKIVTNAEGGQSMHNYGLAVDLAPFNLLTEEPDDLWWPSPDQKKGEVWFELEKALQEAADDRDEDEGGDSLDYEWGGRWRFRDVPHCQVRFTLGELRAGEYPYCTDVEWLVKAHTTFLFGTSWMNRRVQHLLNMQSYNVGAVDGAWGRKSEEALTQFMLDQNFITEKSINKAAVGRLVRLHQAAMSTPRGTLPEDTAG